MSTTQNDVSVRLAMSTQQLSQDAAMAEGIITKFTDKVSHKFETKFNKFFYGGLAGLALHTLKDLLPEAQEFWDSFYGVDEKQGERLDKVREGLRKVSELLEKAKEAYSSAFEKREFKHADDSHKLEMLDIEKEIQDAKIRETRKKFLEYHVSGPPDEKLRTQNPELFERELEHRRQRIEERARLQTKWLEELAKGEKITERREEVEDRIREKQKREDEKSRQQKERDEERELRHQEKIAALKKQIAYNDLKEFMPTLDELANSGQWMRTRFGSRKWWQPGRFAGAAQGIQDLEGDIKADVIEGRGIDPFKRDRLQSLRDQLSKAGVYQDPQHEANERLKELVDAATGKGINVIPQMEE